MALNLAKIALMIVASIFLVVSAPAVTTSAQPQAVACIENYTVQAGDWLSAIAEKYYGDALAYTVIVNATNLMALEDAKYSPITDPSLIEIAQILCIPAGESAEEIINGEVSIPVADPVNPEDKLLAIIGNRSFVNLPTTLKLTGGEFGEGREFTLEAGEEIRLEIEAGDYRASWTSPQGDTFSRDFTAKAGVVAINWFVPEESYIFTEVQRSLDDTFQDQALGQLTTPSVTHTETPYYAPEGKALLVAGNRSFAFLPSTLTISGGQFGGGEEFTINPGQELLVALNPEPYTLTWTAPPAEDGTQLSLGKEINPAPGEVGVIWVIPEENRAFLQSPGQPGQAFE